MKNYILLFLLSLLVFPAFSQSSLTESQKFSLINYLSDNYPTDKLSILDSYEGNFLGSGKQEFLIFLGEKYKQNDKRQPNILKTIVVKFSEDETLLSIYDIPYRTIVFTDIHNSGSLGRGFSQGWIRDYNDNGLDELLLTEAAGSYMVWSIFEFHNGVFKKTFFLDAATTVKEFNENSHIITIIEHLYSDSNGYFQDVEKHLTWSDETECYVATPAIPPSK